MKNTIQCLAFAIVVSCTSALAQSAPVPEDVDALAGALAGRYKTMFTEEQQATLDAINRTLRRAGNIYPPRNTEEEVAAAQQERAGAWNQLQQVLAAYPNPTVISLTDPQVKPAPITMELPGYVGAILIRVDAGAAQVAAAKVEYSFTGDREMSGPMKLRYARDGVTWALLAFHDVPKHTSALNLKLVAEGADSVSVPVRLHTPDDATLSVTVHDEHGNETPAMVRLFWKTGQMHMLPSNAVDMTPQFEGQGGTTSLRSTHYGSSVPGQYGCAPGPFTMNLAPGDWEITVRRGVEHDVLTQQFTLQPGETKALDFTVTPWVDMTDRGWYSGDDHVHSRIMSDDDANRLMTWAKAEDVHLVNIVKMGDIYRTFFEQRGFGPEYRIIDGDYILSPGQECPRTHEELGHTLSMNIKEMVRDTDKYYLYDWVFDNVEAQGGLSGYAHINTDLFFVHRDMTMNIPKGKVDFAEILQFNQLGLDLYYEFLNLGFPLTASAGSDVPWGGTMGESRVYAYLGEQPFTADAWFKAVDDGRTFVSNGPMLEFHVDDALPGDTINVSANKPLHVTARAWGHTGRTTLTKLEVIHLGGVAKEATSEEGAEELSLDLDIDSAHGGWIAARAYALEGTSAHTTPVYIVRDQLRFWNHAAAPDLIAKRLANLDEIEKVVDNARTTVTAEGDAATRPILLLQQQSAALMERVEAARVLYKNLLTTVEDEKAPRATP
jgi:hypothetical protein